MKENCVRVGVGLYIFNERHQVLFGLRQSVHDYGTWCPPGGHLEFGETNENAAVREAKEETGLVILPNDVFFQGVTNDFYAEENLHYITLHFFCTKYIGIPQIMEPQKCLKWQWFDINNLPENLMLPVRNFLKTHTLK